MHIFTIFLIVTWLVVWGIREEDLWLVTKKKDYKYSQVLRLGDIQFNKCNGLSKKNGSAMGTYSAFPFSLLFIKGGSKLEHI